jgi:hypothetical protein
MWGDALVVVEVEMLGLVLRVVRCGDGGVLVGGWVIVISWMRCGWIDVGETRRDVVLMQGARRWYGRRDDDGPGVLVWVCQDDYISGLLLVGGYLCMSKTAVLRLRQRFVLVSGVLFVVWRTRGCLRHLRIRRAKSTMTEIIFG